MWNRTINWMRLSELKQLLNEIIDEINKIDDSINIIKEKEIEVNNANIRINWDNTTSWLLWEIEVAYNEIYWKKDWSGNVIEKWKLGELQEVYSEILEDDEESNYVSLKTQIKDLLSDINNEKIEVDRFILKVEWEYWENEGWEKVKIKEWYFNRIEWQIKKFDEQYEKIKKELDAWATNVALSKVFNDKVKDYDNSEKYWALCFILVLTSMIFFLIIISITNFFTWKINTLTEIFYHILFNLPLFVFIIWLSIFIWNRRAEAKKLEESYKHKEVMARAYIWYKESISDLTNDNNKLLEKHMENLLNAMSVDSSEFLSSKWENHPFMDLVQNIFKKDNFPNGELDFPWLWKITFKK